MCKSGVCIRERTAPKFPNVVDVTGLPSVKLGAARRLPPMLSTRTPTAVMNSNLRPVYCLHTPPTVIYELSTRASSSTNVAKAKH